MRSLPQTVLAMLVTLPLLGVVASSPAAGEATGSAALASGAGRVALQRWSTEREWRQGEREGVAVKGGSIRFARPVGSRVHRDPFGDDGRRHYDLARWTSPVVESGFGLSELIASWNATTPRNTWIEVAARGRLRNGLRGSWDVLGRWAEGDRSFHRTSLRRQRDDYSSVNVDTLVTHPRRRYVSWQLRVTLLRRAGSAQAPAVGSVGAVVSRLPARNGVATSPTGVHKRIDLDVPRYSQMIHKGEYPRWDGGGEAWCSPTSTSMILAYWHSGPSPEQYAWVDDSYPQPWVDYAARHTFDYRYDGTGNWPFNTAYAASFGMDAYVTRLRSLRSAEAYLRAGIPLVASIGFGPGELDQAPITSSSGHLLVIRGFTAAGNVIVNDPAAARARRVRRVYDRDQFEDAWIATTGGVAYVIRPSGTPLP